MLERNRDARHTQSALPIERDSEMIGYNVFSGRNENVTAANCIRKDVPFTAQSCGLSGTFDKTPKSLRRGGGKAIRRTLKPVMPKW
jgi:hypothetical protein